MRCHRVALSRSAYSFGPITDPSDFTDNDRPPSPATSTEGKNVVDAWLHYHDGRVAALEVPSIDAMSENRLGSSRPHPRYFDMIAAAVQHADTIGLDSLSFGWDDDTIRPALDKGVSAAAGSEPVLVLHYMLAPLGGGTVPAPEV